jgi:hypothetical protein
MAEHVFPHGEPPDDDARATEIAAGLAERLLDAISRPQHDWRIDRA